MITYMPFTYISRDHLELIAKALGPLAVYSPAPALVPDHMRRFSDRQLIELRTPEAIETGQLVLALEQFKQWADIHNGGIADMAGFFKSTAGRPPLVDESSPTQITNQIRHFGETQSEDGMAPLFRAALFLAMAQEYDRHQDDMARGLVAVNSLNKKMLAQLSGSGSGRTESLAAGDNRLPAGGADEQGLFMTASRIHAWAELAVADNCTTHLFLTTSRAVMDHLTDLFPDTLPMGSWDMAPGQDADAAVGNRRNAIASIASGPVPDADALSICMAPAQRKGAMQLEVIALTDCAPRSMARRLLSKDHCPEGSPGHDPEAGHTLIGFVCA
jgi:hypothetical protein